MINITPPAVNPLPPAEIDETQPAWWRNEIVVREFG
jgi:hypothetical protein